MWDLVEFLHQFLILTSKSLSGLPPSAVFHCFRFFFSTQEGVLKIILHITSEIFLKVNLVNPCEFWTFMEFVTSYKLTTI